jgi:hypothetical protein
MEEIIELHFLIVQPEWAAKDNGKSQPTKSPWCGDFLFTRIGNLLSNPYHA